MQERRFVPQEARTSPQRRVTRDTFSFAIRDEQVGIAIPVSGVHVEGIPTKTAIPLLYVPGWSASTDTHNPPITHLAQRGYSVFSVDTPRTVQRDSSEYPKIQYAKAEALVETLRMQSVSDVNIVGHSEGAINGTIAAIMALQKGIQVKNLILVAPAGLKGEDNTLHLMLRFFSHSLEEFQAQSADPRTRRNALARRAEGFRAIFLTPIKALLEAHSIANTSLVPLLQMLKEQGVNIAVIQGDGDPVFPIDTMRREARKAGVDVFYNGRGVHNSIIADAEEYTAQIDDAIEKFNPSK